MVAALCSELGVPHTTLPVTVAPGNVQAEARAARYAALGRWRAAAGVSAVATAHHADDQAETLLMRLNRGSGVAGLAGVRPVTEIGDYGLTLLRPLLGWRRQALAEVARRAGLTPVADPANADPRYDRARLRRRLAEADWLDPASVAQSAAHLAEADAALDWALERLWPEAVSREGEIWLYRPGAPRALALRILARIVAEIDGGTPRVSALARFHDDLASGKAGSLGNVAARVTHAGWALRRARKRGGTVADAAPCP